jgi:predicted nuclease of restriction endonuclease-like (RecB) superfamily
MKKPVSSKASGVRKVSTDYFKLINEITLLHSKGRYTAGRAADAVMTVTYWEIGRRIVEFEQKGNHRATYGDRLLEQMSVDLRRTCGRGYSVDNLELMRLFYLTYPSDAISETMSRKSANAPAFGEVPGNSETLSRKSGDGHSAGVFPLSWSHYVLLCRRVKNNHARTFYEKEAIRGGWVVRDLERQIETQYYERTVLSRNKPSANVKNYAPETIDETIKSPYILEFLGLKDEYSESDLEDALITHMEKFLLELGNDFTFVGRQKRLRLGSEWYRVDLVFFHRTLRCLVLIDLKLGRFTHADAGQMHLYLNYARHHWVLSNENPPVGIILCAYKEDAVVKFALENLPNKVIAAEYQTALPDKLVLAQEIKTSRRIIEKHLALIQDKRKQ